MARILISGNSGAGKSTLARKVAEKFSLPLIHLDVHFWNPGWVETDSQKWRQKVTTLAAQDKWVMEGNFAGTLDIRLPRATHLIHLDFPGLYCLFHCIKRRIETGKKVRPDMAEGCLEQVDLSFYKYVLEFPQKHSPQVYKLVEQYFTGDFYVAKNRAEVTKIFSELKI